MMPVVLFLVLLPITINGHGLREVLLIGYFTQMGITASGAPRAECERSQSLSPSCLSQTICFGAFLAASGT